MTVAVDSTALKKVIKIVAVIIITAVAITTATLKATVPKDIIAKVVQNHIDIANVAVHQILNIQMILIRVLFITLKTNLQKVKLLIDIIS